MSFSSSVNKYPDLNGKRTFTGTAPHLVSQPDTVNSLLHGEGARFNVCFEVLIF
jgi:fructose-specific component phosphotransferase system IIB-like protein